MDSRVEEVQKAFSCDETMARMIIKSLTQIGEYEKFKESIKTTEAKNVRT